MVSKIDSKSQLLLSIFICLFFRQNFGSSAGDTKFSIEVRSPIPGSVHPGGVAHFNYTISDCPQNSYIIFNLDEGRVGGENSFFLCSQFMWHGLTNIEAGIRKAYFTLHVANYEEPLAHASTYIEVVPSPGRFCFSFSIMICLA
jgi:hypothetical protein